MPDSWARARFVTGRGHIVTPRLPVAAGLPYSYERMIYTALVRARVILAAVAVLVAVGTLAPTTTTHAEMIGGWSDTGSLNVARWKHTATTLADAPCPATPVTGVTASLNR